MSHREFDPELAEDATSPPSHAETLTGAQIVVRLLERQGVKMIAGIPGGPILPFYDALSASTRITHVLARHEQGAGFIAQGWARATGEAAVCVASSGPGATNLVTAIADAKLDSIPLVAITGQVPRALIGTDAFQEVDTSGITRPDLQAQLPGRQHREAADSHSARLPARAQRSARAGAGRHPQGRAHARRSKSPRWPEPGRRETPDRPTPTRSRRPHGMINAARRPVLYLGGGVIHSERLGAGLRAGGKGGPADHHDPDGAGRDALRPSAVAGHARHARGALHELRARRMRPADRRGRAFRRPRHRQGGGVLPEGEDHPHRHRSRAS